MNKLPHIALAALYILFAACEQNEQQLIGGRFEIAGKPLIDAKVAYVHDDMSCDDVSPTAPYQYHTDGFGWFARYRKIPKSRVKNYFKTEQLCVDRGNGWEIAWENRFDHYPGQIQFACIQSEKMPVWRCVLQCEYCDQNKSKSEIEAIRREQEK